MGHPVDRLFGGIFLAVLVTTTVMVLLTLVPAGNLDEARLLHVGLAVGISACILLPSPVLKRTIWHGRDPFVLDEELNNMIIGRTIGLAVGVAAGVFVLSTVA
ncbi:hypothetical protein [Cupriavidus agavae]|uniref:Uncharacterized protein n=1 Tax=Cupriavidus agavae TaxID=1001822 RepID=A0A4Q7RAZ5_9BURK|nr:hypothetical protein [Cupriavidus agavae]RZT28822.1 hypothetical protein EV147_5212 [Cupriavidus agavae]